VCEAVVGARVAQRDGYALKQCGCGAMFLEPEPSADAVDPREDPHPDSFYALPAAMKLRWLARTHRRGRLLEVGCGRAFFLAEAQRRGFDVAGIEVDPERARRVAAQLDVPVEAALVEHSRWPDASCDVVYHCDLLSHFPDPLLALERMGRMLRPGGAMFFEVGLVGGIGPSWYRRMPPGSWPRHRWFFDRESLTKLLARAGLRVVRMQVYSLGPQVLLYRSASRLLGACRWFLPRRRPATRSVGSSQPRERPGEARINNWLRFGLGRVAPQFGPCTALVLTARSGGGP
jgi:SAM-dependent methyltransferase